MCVSGSSQITMVKRYDFERQFSSEIGGRNALSSGFKGYRLGSNAIKWHSDSSKTTETAVFVSKTKYSKSFGEHETVLSNR